MSYAVFVYRTYLWSLVKIGSVTAEILLTLGLCGGWLVVVYSHFHVKHTLCLVRLRLSCGLDGIATTCHIVGMKGAKYSCNMIFNCHPIFVHFFFWTIEVNILGVLVSGSPNYVTQSKTCHQTKFHSISSKEQSEA